MLDFIISVGDILKDVAAMVFLIGSCLTICLSDIKK